MTKLHLLKNYIFRIQNKLLKRALNTSRKPGNRVGCGFCQEDSPSAYMLFVLLDEIDKLFEWNDSARFN